MHLIHNMLRCCMQHVLACVTSTEHLLSRVLYLHLCCRQHARQRDRACLDITMDSTMPVHVVKSLEDLFQDCCDNRLLKPLHARAAVLHMLFVQPKNLAVQSAAVAIEVLWFATGSSTSPLSRQTSSDSAQSRQQHMA